MRNYRHLLILFSLALVLGCTREQPEAIERSYGEPIPFSVSVETDPLTRATFDGSSINSGNYEFAYGDKLYVSDAGGNISGILNITSGIGSGTATFNGELIPAGGFTPTTDTDLIITLVGASQSSFFPISGDRVTGAPTYPSTISANTPVTDLVQNYSYFTANVKYGVRSYTLHQQTVFLNFCIDLLAISLTDSPSTVQVDIKSANGSSTLRSITDVPVVAGSSASIVKMEFTTVFPVGTSLRGARIVVNNGEGVRCEPDFANDLTLLPNKYYTVARTNVEPFTVEAPSGGSGATITYNYGTNTQYKHYSIENGTWGEWTNYSNPIALSAGDKVSFRGKNTSYNNGGSKPLFTTTNPVNIYGNIMSLMCDENWESKNTVGNKAFYQAFKGVAVDIPDGKELILSADNLGTSCYESMFNGCTTLTKAPILPATTAAAYCYKSMFNGCTALATPPPSLPATTINKQAYYQMFYNCTALTSIPDFPCDSDTNYTLYSGTADKDGVCYQMFYGCSSLTTLADKKLFNSTSPLGKYCFQAMFQNCTSLTTVSSDFLPATTSAASCYKSMFEGCAALVTGPSSLPITTVEASACLNMFKNCSSLTAAPALSSITAVMDYGCKEMFNGCSAMTTPPSSLPAATLGKQAYYWMFYQCSALTSIPEFPCDPNATYSLYSGTADKDGVCYQMFFRCNTLTSLLGKKLFNSSTIGAFCFQDMFSECARLATVPNDFLPALTLAESCYRGMFQSTAITEAPDLLAPALVTDCYRFMFNNCKSLIYIKCYSTAPGSESYTKNWLDKANNSLAAEFHYRSGVVWPRTVHGIPNTNNWSPIADTVQ